MPRLAGSNKGKSGRVTIRLDRPTEEFYKKRAQEAGVPLAEHCRQLLMRGIITENVQQLEKRIEALLHVFSNPPSTKGVTPATADVASALPLDLVRAVFFNREVLTSIISDRNIQLYHQAQDKAEAAAQKLLGGANG